MGKNRIERVVANGFLLSICRPRYLFLNRSPT